jgi:hypothetical protein
MSGAGKSTLLAALATRGWRTVDADDESWCVWDDGDDPGWVWREERVRALVAEPRSAPLLVAGTVPNVGIVAWDRTFLLSAPLDVLLDRVAARTGNPYGKTPDERELIIGQYRDVVPRLRRWADVELDGTRTPSELADEVAAYVDAFRAPQR